MATRVSSDALHCFKIYGDGFCIIESIRRCLRHVGCDVDRQTLLDGISNEVLYKLDYYRKFMSMEEMDPVAEIVSYVEKGVFQSDIGDMVLHVVANLLHIRINIFEYCPMTEEYFLPHEHYVISPVDTISELPVDPKYTVMLKKDGNHYDGLVFKEQLKKQEINTLF